MTLLQAQIFSSKHGCSFADEEQALSKTRAPTSTPSPATSATHKPDDQQQDERAPIVALMIAATMPAPRWMPS